MKQTIGSTCLEEVPFVLYKGSFSHDNYTGKGFVAKRISYYNEETVEFCLVLSSLMTRFAAKMDWLLNALYAWQCECAGPLPNLSYDLTESELHMPEEDQIAAKAFM